MFDSELTSDDCMFYHNLIKLEVLSSNQFIKSGKEENKESSTYYGENTAKYLNSSLDTKRTARINGISFRFTKLDELGPGKIYVMEYKNMRENKSVERN